MPAGVPLESPAHLIVELAVIRVAQAVPEVPHKTDFAKVRKQEYWSSQVAP